MKSVILKRTCMRVFVSLAVGLATPLIAAQAPQNGGAVQVPAAGSAQSPLCDPDLIDATFAFSDQPAGEQTVSIYFRNKDNKTCRLKGPPGPNFAVDSHSMFVVSCPFCGPDGKSIPMWDRRPENQVVLAPGATAATDLSWASTGQSCQWADWANIYFSWTEGYDFRKLTDFLLIPSGWPMHICSSVRSFGYRTAAGSPYTGGLKNPALRVTLLQDKVYSDERATLHVVLAKAPQSIEKSFGCASLYTVRHDAPSDTRLDPLRTVGSSRVDSYTPEQIREDKERAWPRWKKDLERDCDIKAGKTIADAEIAATDLATVTHIEWQTPPTPSGESEFLSVSTHFEVLDVDSLPPNWGEPVNGIRAGLSVDRERFTVGDRVPLHIWSENVNASSPLGQGECGEPEPGVEVQDSKHNVIETIPTYPACFGHGWGPLEIAKGKPHHTFREFTTAPNPGLPILPGPGVYFLVSVWSPRVLEKGDAEVPTHWQMGAGKIGDVYASARSQPVRIEVAPRGSK